MRTFKWLPAFCGLVLMAGLAFSGDSITRGGVKTLTGANGLDAGGTATGDVTLSIIATTCAPGDLLTFDGGLACMTPTYTVLDAGGENCVGGVCQAGTYDAGAFYVLGVPLVNPYSGAACASSGVVSALNGA